MLALGLFGLPDLPLGVVHLFEVGAAVVEVGVPGSAGVVDKFVEGGESKLVGQMRQCRVVARPTEVDGEFIEIV